jgi:hypothetical protein
VLSRANGRSPGTRQRPVNRTRGGPRRPLAAGTTGRPDRPLRGARHQGSPRRRSTATAAYPTRRTTGRLADRSWQAGLEWLRDGAGAGEGCPAEAARTSTGKPRLPGLVGPASRARLVRLAPHRAWLGAGYRQAGRESAGRRTQWLVPARGGNHAIRMSPARKAGAQRVRAGSGFGAGCASGNQIGTRPATGVIAAA